MQSIYSVFPTGSLTCQTLFYILILCSRTSRSFAIRQTWMQTLVRALCLWAHYWISEPQFSQVQDGDNHTCLTGCQEDQGDHLQRTHHVGADYTGSAVKAKFLWGVHYYLGFTLHISDFEFSPLSLPLNTLCLNKTKQPKNLQIGIRTVVYRDSDVQWDTHCLNKFITCWMLFIYLVLGRRCTAKLPPSTSEKSIHQPQSLYYILKFLIFQIKCLALW